MITAQPAAACQRDHVHARLSFEPVKQREQSWMGFGEVGMMVAAGWRGRGVGTALVAAAVEWAREHGLHKIALSVFPHNDAALALYRKFGFVEEGRLVRHIRRADGERWDLIEMGLLL
jgi:RimJ/RimL family protein N-acetyltransferase